MQLMHLPVVLFVMLYKGKSLDKILRVAVQMKAIELYFPVVLFIILYKVVLTFESVDEILKCDHGNESYWAEPPSCTICYAVRGHSYFRICG